MDKMTKEYQEIFFEVKILPVEQLDIKRVEKLISAYITDKNYEEALEVLRVVEDREKNNPLINSEFGYCLVELKQFDEAIKYYLKAKNQGREDAWIYSQLGWAYRNAEKYKEALEAYLKAQQLGDKVAWINAEIGMCYKELGKYEEALKYYLIIINSGELDNDIYKKTWVLSEIAYIYQNIDKYEEAIEYFKKVESLGRKDSWLYANMFNCLKALKNNEEALKYSLMLENFEEFKNDIFVLSNIAHLYEERQEYKEQLKYLEKIEKIGIDDPQFYIEYGYCLMFLEYYREAISKFEKSLGAGKDTYCISQIAFCYRNLGEYEKALEYFQKARSLGRNDAWISLEFGLCYRDLNEYEKALKYFLEAYEKEERYKTDTYLLSSIGKMYDLLGKYENGEEFLRKSYDLGERDRWINMELGECLTRLGKYEEAIEKLLEARRLYMAEGKAPYSEDLELAYCYAALGDKNKAKYHMDSSIEALGAYAESEEYLKKRFTEIKEMINSLK